MQTVSEGCKLCPKDANYVRHLQTMSEIHLNLDLANGFQFTGYFLDKFGKTNQIASPNFFDRVDFRDKILLTNMSHLVNRYFIDVIYQKILIVN